MIIEYLELRNFLSHSDSRIEFTQGINVIVGTNGAGKSSLMDGIRFALHGITDRGDLSDLVMHGKSDFSAKLGFRLNEKTYEVFRSVAVMKGGNIRSEAEIKENGRVVASGIKSVNSYIQKLMGINSDTFYSSIFVKQGEIDQLVSQRPADRKRLFSSIIGIDELERISSVIRDMYRSIEPSSERFFVDPENVEAKVGEYKSLEEERKDLNKSKLDLERQHSGIENEIKSTMEESSRLDQAFFEYQNTVKALGQKEKDSEGLKMEIEKLQKEKDSSAEIILHYQSMIQDPIYINRERIRQIILDLKSLDSSRSEMKEIARKVHKARDLKAEIEKLSLYHNEYLEILDKKKKIEEYLNSRKGFSEEYRVHLRTLEVERQKLEKLKEEMRKLELSVPSQIRGMDASKIAEITDALNKQLQEIKGKIGEINGLIPILDSRIVEVEEKKKMLNGKNSCPVCGSKLTQEHLQEILIDYDAEISKYIHEKASRLSERKQLEIEQDEIARNMGSLTSQSVKRYSTLFSEISRREEELQVLQQTLDSQLPLYREYEEYERSLHQLQPKIEDLSEKEQDYRAKTFLYEDYEKQDLENYLRKLDTTVGEMERKCNESMREVNMDEKTITTVPQRLSEIERQMRSVQPKMDRITEIERNIDRLSGMREMINSEINSMRMKVNSLIHIPEKRDEVMEHLEQLRAKERSCSSELQRTQLLLDEKTREMERLRNEVDLLNEKLQKYKKIRTALDRLWKIKEAFDKDGIQSYIRRESSEAITEKTRRLSSEFGLDIDDVRISEDFEVEVSVDGNVRSLSSLSGGEKTALAIALRMAVADYILNRISLFVLDEPTTFLDEDRRGQLKNILQNSLRDISIVPQLIVITHHQELTKAADTIFSVRKTNGISVIEQS